MAKRTALNAFSDKNLINLNNEIEFITTKLLEQGYKTYEQLDNQEQYKYFYNLVDKVFYEYLILNENTVLEHPNIFFKELLKKCPVNIGTLEDIFEYEKEYFIFLNNDTNTISHRRFVSVNKTNTKN
jgi:hypothetical protein